MRCYEANHKKNALFAANLPTEIAPTPENVLPFVTLVRFSDMDYFLYIRNSIYILKICDFLMGFIFLLDCKLELLTAKTFTE